MKNILLVTCCVFLAGCLQAGDSNLCEECYTSVEERDNAVQKMEAKYKVNEHFLDVMDNNKEYVVKKHTRKYNGIFVVFSNLLEIDNVFGAAFVNMIYLPITLPLSAVHLFTKIPVSYIYGMNLEQENGSTIFVPYSSLQEEYPDYVEKKYNLMTHAEYNKAEEVKITKQKEAQKREQLEKQKREERKKQDEERKKKEQAKLLEDISDCEQSVAKAIEQRKFISEGEKILAFGNEHVVDSNGYVKKADSVPRVVDFAPNGVFISGPYLVYTKDTDYATNEYFRHNDFIYKKIDNYRYKTVLGGTKAVQAFKAIEHKTSELNPETYLQNKNLTCCQYWNEYTGFNEVGGKKQSFDNMYETYVDRCCTRKYQDGNFGDGLWTTATWGNKQKN